MENSIGVVSFSRSGSDVYKELIEFVRILIKLFKEIYVRMFNFLVLMICNKNLLRSILLEYME